MRTTVTLDDELLGRAKQLAARTHRSIGSILEDALREHLEQLSRRPVEPTRLPTFAPANPACDLMSTSTTDTPSPISSTDWDRGTEDEDAGRGLRTRDGSVLLLDVNVLVYAFRPQQSTVARRTRDWLDAALTASEPLSVTTEVLAAHLRIVTHPRIFEVPAPPRAAVEFVDQLLGASLMRVVVPSSRHWGILRSFLEDQHLVGNDVPDAYLAALAIDHSAHLVTADRGFRRFPGLRTVDPAAA